MKELALIVNIQFIEPSAFNGILITLVPTSILAILFTWLDIHN